MEWTPEYRKERFTTVMGGVEHAYQEGKVDERDEAGKPYKRGGMNRNDGLRGDIAEWSFRFWVTGILPTGVWFRRDGMGRLMVRHAKQGRADIVLPDGRKLEVKTGGGRVGNYWRDDNEPAEKAIDPETADIVAYCPVFKHAEVMRAIRGDLTMFKFFTVEDFNEALQTGKACTPKTQWQGEDRQYVAADGHIYRQWGIQPPTLEKILQDYEETDLWMDD